MAGQTITVLPKISHTRDGYRVRYRENGTLRANYLATHEEALARQVELRLMATALEPAPITVEGTGAPADWSRVLWELACQVLNSNERPERKLTVISAAAKAAHGYTDLAKIQKAQEELKRQVAEIRRFRRDGIRPIQGTATPQPGVAGAQPVQ